MKINFGLIAVGHSGHILHFCGYEKPITPVDRDNLQQELDTNPAFELVGKKLAYTLIEAPSEIVERYGKVIDRNTYDINHPLVISLADAAWKVLNHDNDPKSGRPDDTFNWKLVREKIAAVLNKQQRPKL